MKIVAVEGNRICIPVQYIIPEDSGPIRGRRNEARGWEDHDGSSMYLRRNTPYAVGKPQTSVSTMKAAHN
jgi:hypothetical protein